MTVKQYMAIKAIPEEMSTREAGAIKMSILFGKPVEHYEGLSFKEFDKLLPYILFIDTDPVAPVKRTIWIGFTRYKLHDKVSDYNPDTGLSLVHFRTIGLLANIHKFAGWIYRPTFAKHDKYKAANDLLNAKITDVYGGFFLFSKKAKKLKDVLNVYSQMAMMDLAEHLDQVTRHYQEAGDGITPSTI